MAGVAVIMSLHMSLCWQIGTFPPAHALHTRAGRRKPCEMRGLQVLLPRKAQSKRRWTRRMIAAGLLTCLVSPPPALGGSLGIVRGIGGAEASFDGRVWVVLRDTPMPVLDGTDIRTSTGGSLLDLVAGTIVNLLPYTTARVQVRDSVTEALFRCGRLTFRLSDIDRIAILTPAARLESAREGIAVGEVFSDKTGTTGLKVLQGVMLVHELSARRRVVSTGVEPVFVPRRPAAEDPLFISDMAAGPARGTKVIFTPDGKSFGYLRADGQPLVEPGVSADLTGPFPERLVQAALTSVPAEQRERYLPLF